MGTHIKIIVYQAKKNDVGEDMTFFFFQDHGLDYIQEKDHSSENNEHTFHQNLDKKLGHKTLSGSKTPPSLDELL